jgi:hypothetical protein
MSRVYSKLAACAFVMLCCATGVFSQQGGEKVTVTLVRWPYT